MTALLHARVIPCILRRVIGIGRWGHHGEDPVQCDAAEERDAVDIAIEEFAGKGEERAIKNKEEKPAIEVAVVHYVRAGR